MLNLIVRETGVSSLRHLEYPPIPTFPRERGKEPNTPSLARSAGEGWGGGKKTVANYENLNRWQNIGQIS